MAASLDIEYLPGEFPPAPASLLAEGYSARRSRIAGTIRNTLMLSVAVVALTIIIAYGLPRSSPILFITAIILLLLQVFATISYHNLIAVEHQLRSRRVSVVAGSPSPSWLSAAGIAMYHGYFLLFLCFDIAWLFNSYINPGPAQDFNEYLVRLQFGPIDGRGFLIFTAWFWVVYVTLFIIGMYRSDEVESISAVPLPGTVAGPMRGGFSVEVKSPDGRELTLHGVRMPNPGMQPLILWPGFYQNGFVYDLIPEKGVSLAEYLWREGYDCWIVHSRGTDSSGGRWRNASLDDYAALDIPAVIEYVLLHTGIKPIYAGHSQGGITALMSMMGAHKGRNGRITLSDEEGRIRQEQLRGLVTFGSFLDFTYSRKSSLKDFAQHGLRLNIFGMNIRLITGRQILFILRILSYYPVPVGRMLRRGILTHTGVRWLLAPLAFLLNVVAELGLWEFLYHIPNVSTESRRYLFNRTIDATFHSILTQFYGALRNSAMLSHDGGVNYSANYHRLRLPVSFVTMEYDSLADPATTEEHMFSKVRSSEKYHTVWKGMGHEDHFMNPQYFPLVLEALRKIG